MRFAAYRLGGVEGLAAAGGAGPFHGYPATHASHPGSLSSLVAQGSERLMAAGRALLAGPVVNLDAAELLPPLPSPPKILCVGLNYAEHVKETGREQKAHPAIFVRYADSLVADGQPMVKPAVTERFDYEGELGVIVGKKGFRIGQDEAMDYVWGYTIINDMTARERQRDHKQFYIGKSPDTFCPMVRRLNAVILCIHRLLAY